MFVLTDIEWVVNATGQISPTQLAAIRVDEAWNALARFDARICPKDSTFYDWSHMAYTGGTPADFLCAPKIDAVRDAFLSWLSEKDTLLWWHSASDAVFKSHLHAENRSVVLRNYVYAFLPDAKGGVYAIAEAKGIPIDARQMHCSANDALVMLELMRKIAYPQADLQKAMPSALPYRYDPKTDLLHKKECPLVRNAVTKDFATWKKPLQKGYRPCNCCKEEYRRALRERNKEILEHSQYTYVYAPNSAVFHKCTCGVMLSAKTIFGTRKYSTVVKTGRTPCKICNPTPTDAKRALPPTHPPKKIAPKSVKKEVKRAILRQKAASEERSQRLKDASLTTQEKEDIYTLTQPRFAFWSACGYQSFHLRSCCKLNGLSNLRGFGTYQDALRAGCTPCRKCRPTPKQNITLSVPITSRVRSDETPEELEAMCSEAGYANHREGAVLCLETPVGKWRIDLSALPVKLEHINLLQTPNGTKYHEQPKIFLSLIDAFQYIKRHDDTLAKKAAAGHAFVTWIED